MPLVNKPPKVLPTIIVESKSYGGKITIAEQDFDPKDHTKLDEDGEPVKQMIKKRPLKKKGVAKKDTEN